MKKIISINVLLLLVFIIASCSDEFLNLSPKSNVNSADFYNTAEQMESAVHAAYSAFHMGGSYGQLLATIPEMRSDNARLSWMEGDSETTDIIRFIIKNDNIRISSMWDSAYEGILRTNVVLDRIDEIDMDSDLKDRYIGEMKFIRALHYFNLVRLFGDIPLILKEVETVEEGYEYGREDVDVVYEQIIADLSEAEEYLPITYSSEEDIGRATEGAAKALLGKVYLTRKDYTNAEDKLSDVIDSGVYDLLPDYEDLWNLSNENSEESIFEIQFKKGGTGTGSSYANLFPPKFSAPYTVSVGSASGWNSPTQNMSDAYEEDDLRKDISMADGYTNGEGEFVSDKWVLKFMDEPFEPGDGDNNWPVLRYADVLLMYAEVLNELEYVPDGEAFEILNRIRNRAGLDTKTSNNSDPDLRITNQEQFRRAIEHERRVELAFEGHRYFDLIRTDRFVEIMSNYYNVQEHQTLFPIPQNQIDINPDGISQNPGY